MKARRKLRPGQAGTKKLLREYGDRLVCVRYRYDLEQKRRLKTVELIIEEIPWQPSFAHMQLHRIMPIWVRDDEVGLQEEVKAVGGKWNRQRKLWELPYHEVVALGLLDRIVLTDPE
jgi:hypothetical protein